jgi:hypothetical protein
MTGWERTTFTTTSSSDRAAAPSAPKANNAAAIRQERLDTTKHIASHPSDKTLKFQSLPGSIRFLTYRARFYFGLVSSYISVHISVINV